MDTGYLMDASTCTATSKRSGHRCRRRPVPGAFVCRMHGGAAPQVLAKARERLLLAADPCAAELVRLAVSAISEGVRVQACRDLLDRAGLADATKEPATEPVMLDDLSEEVLVRLLRAKRMQHMYGDASPAEISLATRAVADRLLVP